MAASINDKFKKVSADDSYAVATTVKTARTVGGGTTLEAFDLSKWADATAVNFLTYRKTTDPVTNVTTVTNRTGWTALVNTSSNTLTNLTVAPGYTDLGHQVGDYIEPVQMSKWANDLVDGILVTHNADGTLKNKVAALTKINGGSTAGVLTTDASGAVSSVPQYPTAETATNTTYNGKTVYVRIFTGTITASANARTNTPIIASGVENLLDIDGWWTFTSGYVSIIGAADSTGRYSSGLFDVSAGSVGLITTSEAARTNAAYMVRVFYTKV